SRSLEWSKNEIEMCCQSHINCGPPSKLFTPTRLIDVRPQNAAGDVVLRDGSSVPQGSRYCALSYCWGKLKPACLTTNSTLPDRQAGIPWSSLPQTFQDAVKWSRSMGIDYLWIDSVCIIQGDKTDWHRESGRMSKVYGNSYVTVVAACGADPSAGLYSVQHNRPTATRIANLRHESSDKAWPLTFPLLRRAWCFQERLISPRTLFFAPGEMVFQCFDRVSCECGRDDASREDTTSNIKHKHVLPRLKRGIAAMSSTPSNMWWGLIDVYSSLDITVLSDRLPALAGIAEYIHQFRPGEQYLAGLWSDTLVGDLLW
ncbi:heterokaryon incompatibility protein-domain-containing protein, partial [Lasiosphaeria miniovina]